MRISQNFAYILRIIEEEFNNNIDDVVQFSIESHQVTSKVKVDPIFSKTDKLVWLSVVY